MCFSDLFSLLPPMSDSAVRQVDSSPRVVVVVSVPLRFKPQTGSFPPLYFPFQVAVSPPLDFELSKSSTEE